MNKVHETIAKRTVFLTFVGFMVILGILISAIMVSLNSFWRENQRFEYLLQSNMKKSEYLHIMRDAAWERVMRIFMIERLRNSLDAAVQWEAFNASASHFMSARAKLLSLSLTAKEKLTLEEQRKSLSIAYQIFNEIIIAINNEEYDLADQKMTDVAKTAELIKESLDSLIKVSKTQAYIQLDTAKTAYIEARNHVLILVILAIFVCIAVVIFIVTRIRLQQQLLSFALDSMQQNMEQLSERVTARTLELRDARDAALNASQVKSRFLANMSHELRTPLNAVIGYSELLSEEAEEMGHYETFQDVGKIHSAGKYLLDLINDILDISKIEAGKMELYLTDFELKPLINDVVSTIKPLIKRNKNQFSFSFDANIGKIHTDPTRVRQILFNLLSNAAKFTENGQISLDVKAYQDTKQNLWLLYRITDTGIGIPKDKQDQLFKAFSQIDDHNITHKYGGTGLGLVICLHFCKMMGGYIEVDSDTSQGSCFSVHIPQHCHI